MKAYTDLEQSKKLAKILPSETADMWYPDSENRNNIEFGFDATRQQMYIDYKDGLPCWSLGALLSILPSATLDSSNDHYYRLRCMGKCTEWHDNAIDACYKMIIRLKVNK